MLPNFDYLKYIRVFGLEEDPEECFQGLGAAAVSGAADAQAVNVTVECVAPTGEPDSESTLPEQFWTGQNAMIAAEIKYLQQLQADFKARKQEADTKKDQLLEFVEEGIALALARLVYGAVAGSFPALAPVAGFLTQFGVGALFDQLDFWLTEGNAMFDGIIAEDEAIAGVEMSVANYEHRQSVLARHAQQISTILEQLNAIEQGIRQETNFAGGDLTDLFKQAFLTEDAEGYTQGFMNQRLQDLAYNEEILEEPGSGVRVILRGKSRAVEYNE